jgi:hypothetical protein
MQIDPRRLQHTFSKHARDFGISGNYNAANAALLERAIRDHVANSAVRKIVGSYRGTMPVTHYFDPATELNVMVDAADNFIGGWRISPAQRAYLLSSGNLQ